MMWFLIRFWKPLALIALMLGLVATGYAWKAHNAAQAEKIAWLTAEAGRLATELGREKVNVKVVTKYIDRVQVVQGRTKVIIKEIPVYVPATTPDLPAGFRVLHDSAAQGVIPDPARIADASPVPAQDAAETIVSNYGTCAETAEQVIALQDWIRAQQALN